jgi:hypothetical protein
MCTIVGSEHMSAAYPEGAFIDPMTRASSEIGSVHVVVMP